MNCLLAFNPERGKFMAVYLDNILLNILMKEEHLDHVQAVLQLWQKAGLKLKKSKYNGFAMKLNFVAFKLTKKQCMRRSQRREQNLDGLDIRTSKKFVAFSFRRAITVISCELMLTSTCPFIMSAKWVRTSKWVSIEDCHRSKMSVSYDVLGKQRQKRPSKN
jgi:hypothetical protein